MIVQQPAMDRHGADAWLSIVQKSATASEKLEISASLARACGAISVASGCARGNGVPANEYPLSPGKSNHELLPLWCINGSCSQAYLIKRSYFFDPQLDK